jgi:hypothetical protein
MEHANKYIKKKDTRTRKRTHPQQNIYTIKSSTNVMIINISNTT